MKLRRLKIARKLPRIRCKIIILAFVFYLLPLLLNYSCKVDVSNEKSILVDSVSIDSVNNVIKDHLLVLVDTNVYNNSISVFWSYTGFVVFKLNGKHGVSIDSLYLMEPDIESYNISHKFLLAKNDGVVNRYGFYSFNEANFLVSAYDRLWRTHYYHIFRTKEEFSVHEYNFTNDKGLLIHDSYLGEINDHYSCNDDTLLCNSMIIYELSKQNYANPKPVFEKEFNSAVNPRLFDFKGLDNKSECYNFFESCIKIYKGR